MDVYKVLYIQELLGSVFIGLESDVIPKKGKKHQRYGFFMPKRAKIVTSCASIASASAAEVSRITGRIDDVLNVSGHRLGTMEIESALVSHSALVAEAAVVSRPDDVTGEAIVAFVVLKRSRPTGDEAKAIAKELRDWVGKEIGPIAKPKDIRFGDNLPKTRSGKIMRRLLRSIAKGEEITQDISTLENPAILEQLKQSL